MRISPPYIYTSMYQKSLMTSTDIFLTTQYYHPHQIGYYLMKTILEEIILNPIKNNHGFGFLNIKPITKHEKYY